MRALLPALLFLCLGAGDPDRCVVTLSSGERVEGAFSLTEGKRLEVFDVKSKRRVAVAPAEVARVSVSVEWEKLEQGWTWKEEGDHEKVKLPFRCPLRKLLTEVTLVSGEVVTGHSTCVFYVEPEGSTEGARRFFLLADQKGEKGQTLAEVVYVKEVAFPERAAGAARLGTIRAPAPAAAVSLERDASFQSPLTGLLSGKYDVFLFPPARESAGKVRFGLTGAVLATDERKLVDAKVASIEEFFTTKRIVAATKDGATIRALLELSRTEECVDKGFGFVRWEVWTFERTSESVEVRKRFYLHRLRYEKGAVAPAFEYLADDKLRGVAHEAVIE